MSRWKNRISSGCKSTIGSHSSEIDMTKSSELGETDSLVLRWFAADELVTLIKSKEGVSSFKVVDGLKVTDNTWVFVARLNGVKVVVKRFLTKEAPHTVRTLKRELDFLETVWIDDRFRSNRCLYAWPEDGIAVLSFAPGGRLSHKIAQSSGKARAQLFRQSGEWLKQYCAPRQRVTKFGPGFWVRQLATRSIDHVSSREDKCLLADLLTNLKERANRTMGVQVVQAATHGDFVGINAHYHRGTIYGLDIQGECWLAMSKDVAKFLVWQGIHHLCNSGKTTYGIDRADFDALLSSGVLLNEEMETTLPFFIGAQLYTRFIDEYGRPEIEKNTKLTIERFILQKV